MLDRQNICYLITYIAASLAVFIAVTAAAPPDRGGGRGRRGAGSRGWSGRHGRRRTPVSLTAGNVAVAAVSLTAAAASLIAVAASPVSASQCSHKAYVLLASAV